MGFLQVHSQTIDIGGDRTITIETGKMARQADGAVVVKMGKCALLATVVSKTEMREGVDFFPLSVDYQEKFASAGRIPGGFLKRESRLSNYEILICRLVDRALRPIFPDGYRYETQIMISLISSDPEVMPDSLTGLAASAAIAISDIPFNGPISEVRVARIDGEFVVNPTYTELEQADMDLMIAASKENIIMVEGESHECSEEEWVEAIRIGHEAIIVQCEAQEELAAKLGVTKRDFEVQPENEEIKANVFALGKDKVYAVAKSAADKSTRRDGLKAIKDEIIASYGEEITEEEKHFVDKYYKDLEKKVIRDMILDDEVRLDGRGLTEVRPLEMEVNLLPSPHGCALFTRGETQSLTTVTLGSKQDEKMLDKAKGLEFSKFMLHYNFPAFSVGEARPNRGPGRREIGHGHLAKRALEQVLPSDEENPYTVRVVSDILESNGSSSMATVCAGSLALMDAGIKIKRGVSGIAMGLISRDEDGKVAVLTDILGDEDHLGDMDFKVAGTENGICAVQMDIKISGLTYEILNKALAQSKVGRMHILNAMNEVISEPREDLKPHAPRVHKMIVAKEFIGAIIGPGGKVIQEMQKETNTIIFIEEIENEGHVTITSPDKESIDAAISRIRGLVSLPEVGEVYKAKVKSIMPYGAFVEFMPGKEGLLHISEISWKRLETMDGVFEEGDMIEVKLVGIDSRSGKCKLSRKALLDNPHGGSNDRRENRRDDRNREKKTITKKFRR